MFDLKVSLKYVILNFFYICLCSKFDKWFWLNQLFDMRVTPPTRDTVLLWNTQLNTLTSGPAQPADQPNYFIPVSLFNFFQFSLFYFFYCFSGWRGAEKNQH